MLMLRTIFFCENKYEKLRQMTLMFFSFSSVYVAYLRHFYIIMSHRVFSPHQKYIRHTPTIRGETTDLNQLKFKIKSKIIFLFTLIEYHRN
jgi:hypothetical protein